MTSRRTICGALLAAVLLAGCQSDGPAESDPRSPGYGVSEPGWVSPPPFGGHISRDYSRSKTRTWVSEDGTRHTKSSGSNVRVSMDPNAAAAVMTELLGGGAGRPSYVQASNPDAYLGKWRVAAAGRECELTLSQGRSNGGRASVFGCMNTDLIKVGSWSLRGYELVLSSFVGDHVASLRVTQPNRMDGSIQGGTPMTVWR